MCDSGARLRVFGSPQAEGKATPLEDQNVTPAPLTKVTNNRDLKRIYNAIEKMVRGQGGAPGDGAALRRAAVFRTPRRRTLRRRGALSARRKPADAPALAA